MREVRLYGWLGREFGRVHHFVVSTPAEAIAALSANFPRFKAALMQRNQPGYHVFTGKRNINESQLKQIASDELVIKIIPAIAGAKQGVLQTILGIVLIAVGVYFEQPWLIQMGAAMAFGGVAQMLAPQPKLKDNNEKPENKPSYFFDGPVNTTGQGLPVPVLYGRLVVGSAVIYSAIKVDEYISATPPVSPPIPNMPFYLSRNPLAVTA
jgi:predicted phage tail protein